MKGALADVPIKDAIKQIENGSASYTVGTSDVHVVNGQTGKYLRTEPDGKSGNNLDNLPDT